MAKSTCITGWVANFILAIGILSNIFVNSVERQFIPEVSSYLQNFFRAICLKSGDILIAINEKVSSLQDIRLEPFLYQAQMESLILLF